MLPQLIRYFHDCYQTEFRAINLLDFWGKKIAHRLILQQKEFLEMGSTVPLIDADWAAEVIQELLIYGKEKDLYFGAFFLIGRTSIAGRPQPLHAPLFLYPAAVKRVGEEYTLTLEEDKRILNPAVLNVASTLNSGLYEELLSALPQGPFDARQLEQVQAVLQEQLPELDVEALAEYPQLHTEEQLKKRRRSRQPSFSIVPAFGACLIDKPSGSRGILNELSEMAEGEQFAVPIQELFGEQAARDPLDFPEGFRVPVSLSRSQQDILHSAAEENLSLVVGPPGTGKSFTIAALAVELLSRGYSVLIAAKKQQAVNVVADKIEQDFDLPGLVIRAASKDYRRTLQQRVKDILNGIGVEPVSNGKIERREQTLKALDHDIERLERLIHIQEKKSMKRGFYLHERQHKPFFGLQKWWIRRRQAREKALWTQFKELENLRFDRIKALRRLIKNYFNYYLYSALRHSRADLMYLKDALRARSGNLQEGYFNKVNFKHILDALPIWTCTLSDIHSVLPLQAELFDVVIIDEASQCDIAASLPALQRGRSAVIVGDPKQLRHLSFLARQQQQELIKKHELQRYHQQKLDYRNVSLLDLTSMAIEDQKQVHFLDEHYRSMPDIIEFSNRKFYGGRLKVMTSCPATLGRQHVFLHKIEGKRDKKGINQIEADYVLTLVAEIVQSERHLEKNLCQRIGILSPFRDQVNFLQARLNEFVDLSIFQRHKLLIGTPYDFQGEERDVMLLSFALDDEAHPSGFQYLNRPDVFNVSITRARSLQHVVTSFSENKPSANSLLAAFLGSLERGVYQKEAADHRAKNDAFLQEVVQQLSKWKIEELYYSYPIAGLEIDLLVVREGQSYCIDLVGYPGSFEDTLPVDRRLMLERVGLRTFTLPYSQWQLAPQESRQALRYFLNI